MAEWEQESKGNAAERLTTMADKMTESANAKLSQERQVNTARRAAMASSAEADARNSLRLAKTMKQLAEAITKGLAPLLDGIRTRTQVETLENIIRRAKQEHGRLNNERWTKTTNVRQLPRIWHRRNIPIHTFTKDRFRD